MWGARRTRTPVVCHGGLHGSQRADKLGVVFGRKKQDVPAPTPEPEETPQRKGRPTPTRREAQARNRQPIISTDPKVDRKAAKSAAREERAKMNQALMTGDERHLPPAHKGPVKRYIRDAIDARRMLGEYFFPLTIVIIVALFMVNNLAPEHAMLVILTLYVVVLIAVAHSIWVSFQIKKELTAKFGPVRGTHMYAVARSMQMRRMRLPKPQVKRGEYPS